MKNQGPEDAEQKPQGDPTYLLAEFTRLSRSHSDLRTWVIRGSIISLIVFLIGAVLFYKLSYSPLVNEVRALREEVDSLREQATLLRAELGETESALSDAVQTVRTQGGVIDQLRIEIEQLRQEIQSLRSRVGALAPRSSSRARAPPWWESLPESLRSFAQKFVRCGVEEVIETLTLRALYRVFAQRAWLPFLLEFTHLSLRWSLVGHAVSIALCVFF